MANLFVIKTTVKNLDNSARAYVETRQYTSMSEARSELEAQRKLVVSDGGEVRLSLPESLVYVSRGNHLVSKSISFERNV